MSARWRRYAALAAVVLLAACATSPEVPVDGALDTYIAERIAAAEALERDGRLAEAVFNWKVVDALTTNNDRARTQLKRLQAEIQRKADAHVARGNRELKSGRTRQARNAYLKALALDGGHRDARAKLAGMEVTRIMANQETKDKEAIENQMADEAARYEGQKADTRLQAIRAHVAAGRFASAVAAGRDYVAANPANKAAKDLLVEAYKGLILKNIDEERLDAARSNLSEGIRMAPRSASFAAEQEALAGALYGDGLRLMQANLDEAIVRLEQTLQLEPDHFQAKRRLAQARKMRDRLKLIEQGAGQ